MKKIVSVSAALAALLFTTTIMAQTTIQFKGKDFIVAGTSAGAIKGNNNNPSFFECFWDINKETKTLTGSTLQTFKTGENNKDIVVRSIAIADINLDQLDDEVSPDENSFEEVVYTVNLNAKEYNKVVKTWSCYRFSEDDTLAADDNTWTLRVIFKEKAAAEAFVKELKSVN